MPLTLVLGPANAAKAGEVLGAYADAAHRGALLVVPTAADADHYAREVAGQGAVLGSVLTFAGLAREIARRTGYNAVTLSPLARLRAVRRASRSAALEVFESSARSPGFAASAGALIAELERSLITPARLSAALRAWSRDDSRRARYAHDIGALYRGYERELDRIGRVDSDLFAWRALDALRAAPGTWGATPVFFYGFDDLDELERDAVETLARVAHAEVTVSLTYESGRLAFAARAEAVEELRPLADRVAELEALDEHYEPGSREVLHHLERSLFEPPTARVPAGDAVRLFEAGGERAEAELIAGEVLSLLREGVPGEEIVVISRSAVRAAPVIERVFAQYGISVAGEYRMPLDHSPFGRGLIALCRCAWAPRADADELLAYLRCPGVLERPELADGLERTVRRRGLRTVLEAREALGWQLSEIDSLRDAEDRAAELGRRARTLLAAPVRGEGAVLEPAHELDARALGTLLGALDELAELGERPSGEELLELVESLEVPAVAPMRPGAVLLSDPLSVRARRFRAVFVCGLGEGEFPLQGAPEPFLSDERRREIASCSGLRLRAGEDGLARERYLFYACVSRATSRLILSYRSSDEEGNIELRSPFLDDVEELLADGWAAGRRKRLLADVVWPSDVAPTERERARSRAASSAPGAGEPPEPERSISQAALGHVRHREVVSGGALESYADCPVKWFVERELAPRRFEPDPEPLARGSYIHEVLEKLLARLGGPVTEQSLPRARELLAELIDELPSSLSPGRSAPVRAATLRAIEGDLRRYLEHEAADGLSWPQRGLELRFGFEATEDGEPALEPVMLDGEIPLRGVIDRLDVDPDGSGRAIVRDYKSGRSRPEYQGARWQSDRRLQVALYMLAARRLLGLEPVAGFYQPLGGPDLRARGAFLKGSEVGTKVVATDGRTEEELEEMLVDAERRAAEIARRIREGELAPCPQTCSRDGCSYPGICRSQ